MGCTQSQIIGANSNDSVFAQVDRYHQALRVSMRPWEHDSGGHYRTAARSGAVTGAGVVAGAPLYAFQWNAPQMLALILRVRAFWIPTVAFTAAQELGLDMIHATVFPTAYTGGTVLTPSVMRKSMVPSQLAPAPSPSSDLRIATVTLLTVGAPAPTFDTNAIEIGGGLVNVVNAAAGTAYVNPNSGGLPPFGFDYDASQYEFPLTLARGEGFVIRNTVGFPAAGAATLVVRVIHLEIPTPSSIILPAG